MSKNLIFRVCKEDFHKFYQENLRSRFREDTPHWHSRLVEKNWNFKKFDEIHIINGYKSDSPTIIFEFKKIILTQNKGIDGFLIEFGDIKTIKNVE